MSALPPDTGPEFVRAMGSVAHELLGEPNRALSTRDELRFGSRGSLSVHLAGGRWYDHELGQGGGVIDLVQRQRSTDRAGALAWLRERRHLEAPTSTRPRRHQVAAYDYRDEHGELFFQVVRFEPKDFRQRRPDGDGWTWKIGGTRRVLFRLPEVLAAVAAGRTIYVAEGEKATLALVAAGLDATCSPGGAGKWRPEFAEALGGADVVVLPDNDEPGRRHAHQVREALQGVAKLVRVVELPGLPAKGDVADWLGVGGDRAALEALVQQQAAEPESAPEEAGHKRSPRKQQAAASASNELILMPGAPLVSARRFLELRHLASGLRTLHHQQGTFYGWNGACYVETSPEEMRARLYGFLDGAKRVTDDGEVVPFDPTRAKVANVLEATAAEAQLPASVRAPAWLEGEGQPDPAEVIAAANGLLHLPTRRMRPHTPAFFTTNALPYPYHPRPPQPTEWLRFLEAVWPNDPQAIATLQEAFGLCLTGETKHQKAFLVVGPKRSGKGTIARVLTHLLGAANVAGPTLSSLAQNFGLAPLIGKRLAIVSDARLGGRVDQQVIVERILSITGEDGITVDRKFRDSWTGQLSVRFVILSNELPRLTDASGALAGRFVILVMKRSFYGREDLGLMGRLTPELPGILGWALDGYDRLQARGHFVAPDSSRLAQEELENLGSPIGAFLRECCHVAPGCGIRCDDLYRLWCSWCQEQGRDHPGNAQTFGRDLRAAVPGLETANRRADGDKRERWYEGVGLSPDRVERGGTRTTTLQPDSPAYYADDPQHWGEA